ncbi:aminotransferase class V-fold PLP-dependent enzyme [Amylibacter sp.]|nr:aminotransferase class V-fold PLP-dependent enzyme [Amylibacter sp.]
MADIFQMITDDLDNASFDHLQDASEEYINFNAANMGVLPKIFFDRVNYHKLQISSPNQNYRLRDEFIERIKHKISILCPDPTGKSLHLTYGTTLVFNLICLMFKVQNKRQNFITLFGEHDGLLAPFSEFTNLQVVENIEILEEKLKTSSIDGICVSDIRYKDGVRNDLRQIAELRDRYAPDAIIVADLAQSFSIVDLPFECFDIGVASAHKWMAGAGGHGFIWVNKEIEKELLSLKGTQAKFNDLGFVGGHDFKGLIETYQATTLRLKSSSGHKIGLKKHINKFNSHSKLKIITNTDCFNILPLSEIDDMYKTYTQIIKQKLDVKFINDSDPIFRITIPYYASDSAISKGFDILSENLCDQ